MQRPASQVQVKSSMNTKLRAKKETFFKVRIALMHRIVVFPVFIFWSNATGVILPSDRVRFMQLLHTEVLHALSLGRAERPARIAARIAAVKQLVEAEAVEREKRNVWPRRQARFEILNSGMPEPERAIALSEFDEKERQSLAAEIARLELEKNNIDRAAAIWKEFHARNEMTAAQVVQRALYLFADLQRSEPRIEWTQLALPTAAHAIVFIAHQLAEYVASLY